ncbi:hypothetical protein [Streptosporangium sp. KLBMP 9127]|nr:hypothetical protein [Streptosporangium sp. KLBMP 9127]
MTNVPAQAPFDGPESWGTDLAFQGKYAYVGNFDGFTVYDITDPRKPVTVSQVLCPGGQNDVSVSGNLLFLSIDDPRSDETCDSDPADGLPDQGWEGIRIFDITDKAKPKYVSSVATACGSHTHTMIPGKKGEVLYLYASSPGPIAGSRTCAPPRDKISVVEVPLGNPAKSRVVAEPEVFDRDQSTGQGGELELAGCHDITAYPEKNLAAGACFGDGVLLDISDPVKPRVLQQIDDDENFSIWHSATFNDDASKVVFTDELGGGGSATCDSNTPSTKGANAIYDLKDDKLTLNGYFKIPREQTESENCVAHNGSLLPIKGKDIMVQAWYQGGISIWDFTDADRPKEIGYFERGPLKGDAGLGGSWSAYYYNGYIYSSDITKGLDVIAINDPLTDPAKNVVMEDFNVQTQRSYF